MSKQSPDDFIATRIHPLTLMAKTHRSWLDRISEASLEDEKYYYQAWELPVEAATAHEIWKQLVGEDFNNARLASLRVALNQRKRNDGGADTVPDLVKLIRPKISQLLHIYKTQFNVIWQVGTTQQAELQDEIVLASAAATAEPSESQAAANTQHQQASGEDMWSQEVGMMYFTLEALNELIRAISLQKQAVA